MPPPGMFPMMPPPRPQRGFTRMIFMTLAGTIFSISLLANIYLLAYAGVFGSSGTLENTVAEGRADQKIAVVPITGIIDGSTAAQVNEWFKKIEKDKNIKAVVLAIDTPGGSVTASDQIHHYVQRLRQNRNLPIAVTMGGLATSGGYYIACTADHIVAQETTLTGNIGVLMPRFNLSEMVKRWGIEERSLTSPREGFKNAGSMFSPENEKDREYLQKIIDNAYTRFTTLVDQGRKGKLSGDTRELYNGQVFTARDARANGLVDEIGYPDAAYAWAASTAGLSQPRIVRYQSRPTLLQLLTARSGIGFSGGNAALNINLDSKTIDELSTPRLLYLWRGD
jgi:protease IV